MTKAQFDDWLSKKKNFEKNSVNKLLHKLIGKRITK